MCNLTHLEILTVRMKPTSRINIQIKSVKSMLFLRWGRYILKQQSNYLKLGFLYNLVRR